MKRLTLLVIAVVFIVTPLCTAEDLNAPWWRGQPGTTVQGWEFGDPNPNPLPDWGLNPNGDPAIQITPGVGQEWWQEYGGRFGVWPLSGEIIVEIPNFIEPNPLKLIWIQLTWSPQVPGGVIQFLQENDSGIAGVLQQELVLGPNPAVPNEFWYHSTYLITLPYNPPFETILISGSVDVDELVIDTWCTVPEPGTMALFGVCMLALLRRKR